MTDIKVPEEHRGAFGKNRGERRQHDKRNHSSKGNKTHNDGKPFGAYQNKRKPDSKHQGTNRKGRH